jgi:hypothetical protein
VSTALNYVSTVAGSYRYHCCSLLSTFLTAIVMHTVLNTELWEWRAARTACPAFVGQSCLLVTLPAAAQHNNNNNNNSTISSINSTSCSQEEAQLEQDVGTQIDATADDDDEQAEVVAATESKEVHMLAFFGGQVRYIHYKTYATTCIAAAAAIYNAM